jgi:hypothetical protein
MPRCHRTIARSVGLGCFSVASAEHIADSLWHTLSDTSAQWLDHRDALRSLHRMDTTLSAFEAARRTQGTKADTLWRSFVMQRTLARLALSAERPRSRRMPRTTGRVKPGQPPSPMALS